MSVIVPASDDANTPIWNQITTLQNLIANNPGSAATGDYQNSLLAFQQQLVTNLVANGLVSATSILNLCTYGI